MREGRPEGMALQVGDWFIDDQDDRLYLAVVCDGCGKLIRSSLEIPVVATHCLKCAKKEE